MMRRPGTVDEAKYHRLNKIGEGYIDLQVQKKSEKRFVYSIAKFLSRLTIAS